LAGLHRNIPVYARVAELLGIQGYEKCWAVQDKDEAFAGGVHEG
jgi:hypothetical protein